MKEVTHPRARIEWLTENYDLTERNAEALILAELGFSHSGIASKLGVTQGTARKYLKNLENEIGEYVTQTFPKPVRYATFPGDTPKDEVRYSGGDVSEENADLEPNRGVALGEIDEAILRGETS